jgi:D-alanyl-D-alanine carboxypeptidase
MRVFHKRKFYTAVILFLAFYVTHAVAAYSVSCKSAIFSNSTKVVRYYGKNVHGRVIPASTTKVMTALVVMEKLSLDDWVTVSKNATYPQPSKIYVKEGEQYKVRDLLYAILLSSANDASVVLAEAVAGTHWEFVTMMNNKAKQIGAKSTRFANANGLPTKKDDQYTTAYDMYLIFRKALEYPLFREIVNEKYKTIYSRDGKKVSLKSHNKILFNDWRRKIYGKTGYTHAAGACFVGTINKGKDALIIAVFKCKSRWDDIKHIVSQYGGIRL